jgi:hypothetical protein
MERRACNAACVQVRPPKHAAIGTGYRRVPTSIADQFWQYAREAILSRPPPPQGLPGRPRGATLKSTAGADERPTRTLSRRGRLLFL